MQSSLPGLFHVVRAYLVCVLIITILIILIIIFLFIYFYYYPIVSYGFLYGLFYCSCSRSPYTDPLVLWVSLYGPFSALGLLIRTL